MKALIWLALLTASAAQAQNPPLVGSRVRIARTSGPPIVGSVLAAENGSITVAVSHSQPLQSLTIDPTEIRQVELSLGRQSNAGRGAAIGAGIGASLGLALSIGISNDPFLSSGADGGAYAGIVVMGTTAGGLMRVLMGSLGHHERWKLLANPSQGRIGVTGAIGARR